MPDLEKLYGFYGCPVEEQCGIYVDGTKNTDEITKIIQAMQNVCRARQGEGCPSGCPIEELRQKIAPPQEEVTR